MALSLEQQMVPGQRMQTVTIDEILSLAGRLEKEHPPLEHYFSPFRKEKFLKDYLHFLNSSLLDARHGQLHLDLYLLLVLSFQFIIPLLEIPAQKELDLFLEILERRYDLDDPDINIHFTIDSDGEGLLSEDEIVSKGGMGSGAEMVSGEALVSEEEALSSFRQELDESYTGRRGVKESVQKRLKQDGIAAIMKWQEMKGITELAEAFGRCAVIPVFFSFPDKKLLSFYRKTTPGILYEVAVPEFD